MCVAGGGVEEGYSVVGGCDCLEPTCCMCVRGIPVAARSTSVFMSASDCCMSVEPA